MSVVVENLIRGAQLTLNADGVSYSAVRVYDVSEISGAAEDVVENGVNDAGLPALGDSYSTALPGLIALKKFASGVTGRAVEVMVTYGVATQENAGTQPNPPQTGTGVIEIGASVISTTTGIDRNGDQITASHTFTVDGADEPDVVAGEVQILVPQMLLRQQRLESDHPLSVAQTHVGRVNNATSWGFDAETLLCTRIEGVSEDNGASYLVTYEFQYDPNGWAATYQYENSKTGRPETPIVEGEDRVDYDIYPTANFATLGLSFS